MRRVLRRRVTTTTNFDEIVYRRRRASAYHWPAIMLHRVWFDWAANSYTDGGRGAQILYVRLRDPDRWGEVWTAPIVPNHSGLDESAWQAVLACRRWVKESTTGFLLREFTRLPVLIAADELHWAGDTNNIATSDVYGLVLEYEDVWLPGWREFDSAILQGVAGPIATVT